MDELFKTKAYRNADTYAQEKMCSKCNWGESRCVCNDGVAVCDNCGKFLQAVINLTEENKQLKSDLRKLVEELRDPELPRNNEDLDGGTLDYCSDRIENLLNGGE